MPQVSLHAASARPCSKGDYRLPEATPQSRDTLGDMTSVVPARPAISAMVMITMVLVALFGQGAIDAFAHTGDQLSALESATADHVSRGSSRAGEDAPRFGDDVRSPCLHSDACAGGGALNLGDNTFGVVPESVGTPTLPQSDVTEQQPPSAPGAPTLAHLERPPQGT